VALGEELTVRICGSSIFPARRMTFSNSKEADALREINLFLNALRWSLDGYCRRQTRLTSGQYNAKVDCASLACVIGSAGAKSPRDERHCAYQGNRRRPENHLNDRFLWHGTSCLPRCKRQHRVSSPHTLASTLAIHAAKQP